MKRSQSSAQAYPGFWSRVRGRRKVVALGKSRGLGGRLTTKRVGEAVFDTGAQYFTAKSERFAGGRWRQEHHINPSQRLTLHLSQFSGPAQSGNSFLR